MAFEPGDPRINRKGRPPGPSAINKKMSKRQKMDMEFEYLLRKIKPHVADSIMTAAKIMKNDHATDQSKLKAAVILLDAYKTTVKDVYTEDDEASEKDEDTSVGFSLTVVG